MGVSGAAARIASDQRSRPAARVGGHSVWDRWWRWLWFTAFVGGSLVVVRDVDALREAPLGLEVAHRLLSVGLIGFLLLPRIIRSPGAVFRGVPGLLVAFALWRLGSTGWSVYPEWTLYRSVEYLIIALLTVYTASSMKTSAEFYAWLNAVWGWLAVLVALAWKDILLFPQEALRPSASGALVPFQLFGVLPIQNAAGLAQLAGILAIVGINRWLEGRRSALWFVLVAWAVVTMGIAQGRSAIAGFLLGALLVVVLRKRWNVLALVGVVTLGLIMESARNVAVGFLQRGQSVELLMSFSGRKYWWDYTWTQLILERPILGFGAFTGGRFLVQPVVGSPFGSTVDNAWVELWLDTGIVGVVVFALLVAWMLRIFLVAATLSAHADPDKRNTAIECSGVLGLLLVRSWFGSSMTLQGAFPVFALVGYAAFLQRSARRGSPR